MGFMVFKLTGSDSRFQRKNWFGNKTSERKQSSTTPTQGRRKKISKEPCPTQTKVTMAIGNKEEIRLRIRTRKHNNRTKNTRKPRRLPVTKPQNIQKYFKPSVPREKPPEPRTLTTKKLDMTEQKGRTKIIIIHLVSPNFPLFLQ